MVIAIKGAKKDLHPKLRLFLSADIVGSTPLKQPFDIEDDFDGTSILFWPNVIQTFYDDVPAVLLENWRKLGFQISEALGKDYASVVKDHIGDPPVFWKTVGDEVLFWKDITNDRQIWFVFCVWLQTMSEIRDRMREKRKDRRALLDVKCTVWMGGFPVRNRMIAPRGGGKGTANVDFIGPAMDVGFRLSQWSSATRFMMSVDVAYFLAATDSIYKGWEAKLHDKKEDITLVRKNIDKIKIHFDGTEFMRGVLGGLHYPKFFIDMIIPETLDDFHSKISKADLTGVPLIDVIKYCNKFYEDRKKFIFKPFINKLDSFSHNNIPPNYQKYYDHLVNS